MDGVRSGKEDKVKSVVMDGFKTGKVGTFEDCKIDDEMWSQSEERLCKSITKADVEEEQ